MSSLLNALEAPLGKIASKLGQQPHLNAIRDGVVGSLPLVLIGSLFMIIGQPPVTKELADKFSSIRIVQPTVGVQVLVLYLVLFAVLVAVLAIAVYRLVKFLAARFRIPLGNVVAVLLALLVVFAGFMVLAGRAEGIESAWYSALRTSQPHTAFLVPQLLVAARVLTGLIALYVAFGVAHSLARRYNQDALSAGLLSVASLLLMNGMQIVSVDGMPKPVKFIPMDNFSSGGLFMGLFIGLIVPEVQRFVKRRRIEITMPAGVPPAVGRSFSALIPGLFVMGPIWVLVHLLGIDLFALVNAALTQPIRAISAPGPIGFVFLLVVVLIDSVLWLLGVHAVAILAPMAAIWADNISANFNNGEVLLNTREAFQFYIWLGGSGATIALPFLLLRARAASLRAIAKVGAVPALFNINEPIIFGVPVMMNLTLAIPFIVAPIVTLTTTMLATNYGLVPVPHLMVPWTLPGPIGAFFATGGAWSSAALSVINIALATLIYWPFVRAYDRKVAEAEAVAAHEVEKTATV